MRSLRGFTVLLVLAGGCVPGGPEAEIGASEAALTTSYAVKVYFSKFPESLSNPGAVFPVERSSPTLAVATFATQLLIAGPTLQERSDGYFSELNSILTGPSSCSAPFPTGGPDFAITLSSGTATAQLCRDTQSPGVGADARILAEVSATLRQFSTIKKAVLLTREGHCFGDASGTDPCLH
jgi:hypothetical protein